MYSIAQIENGLARFIDNELAPKMPTDGPNGGLKRLAFLVGLTYKLHAQLPAALGSMGAVDQNGNVDLEGLIVAISKYLPESGLRVQVPVVDELIFYPADLERMKSYIIGG